MAHSWKIMAVKPVQKSMQFFRHLANHHPTDTSEGGHLSIFPYHTQKQTHLGIQEATLHYSLYPEPMLGMSVKYE
jgi:hypothetical protein